MSTNAGTKDIRSHAVPDLSESTTNTQADLGDTASSKAPSSVDYASIPLKSSAPSAQTSATTNAGTAKTVDGGSTSAPATTGGGVTGYLKSFLGGGQKQTTPSETTVPPSDAKPQVMYETELKGGTGAQVATAPGHSSVPDSLQNSHLPVGTATTTFEEPVSEFAPALASIAGEPEASDPTKKYGHALDSLTGEKPVASTSPGYISSVYNYAADTVKHAVGLDADTSSTPKATETGNAGSNTAVGTGTGVTPAVKSSPNVITIDDLPKGGRVHPHEDGSVDVGRGETSSLAAREAAGPTTGGSYTKTPVMFEDEDTEVITPKDLPKSGTVEAHKDGSADVREAPTPGLFAAAVGTVLGGAEYVKETVTHLVTGDQAGDTSEQIKALDSKNEVPPVSAAPVTTPSSLNEAGAAKPTIEFEDSEPIGSAVKDTASSSAIVPPVPSSSTSSGKPASFPYEVPSGKPASFAYEEESPSTGSPALPSGGISSTPGATKDTTTRDSYVPSASSRPTATPVTSSTPTTTSRSEVAPRTTTEPSSASRAVPTASAVPTGSYAPTASAAPTTSSVPKSETPTTTSKPVEAAAPGAGLGATAAGLGARMGADADLASAKKPVDTTPATKSTDTSAAKGTGATAAALGQRMGADADPTSTASTSSPVTKPTTAGTSSATTGATPATAGVSSATAGSTPKADTTTQPATGSGVSNVKEVGAVPSNAVPESTKAGKETVRTPTGEVVSAAPGSTASKAPAGTSTSSQPVVSAFASPRSTATDGKVAEAAKDGVTGSTAKKTTPLDKGKEVATPAGTTAAAAQEVKPATGNTAAADSKPATGSTTAASPKPAAATSTAAAKKQKEEKKSGGMCSCCVIS